jgi:beta-glucosidase
VSNDPTFLFCDASLPIEDRISDLLGRMTLEEKAAQLSSPFGAVVNVHNPPVTGWGTAVAALSSLDATPRAMARAANELQRKHVEETRLGIPVLLGEEALLGFKVRDAVVFPDAIAQAATWQPELIEEMADMIGRQMTAIGVRQALSPLADTARDPRWGRVEETYGEDPYLVGTMATAFVRGLQNADPDKPIIATLKHFIGYSASEGGRNTDAAQIGERELREVHSVPFEMAIRAGGARGIMPSYNTVDGVPVTGSSDLLQGLLRDELGFDGITMSDLNAIAQLATKHGVAADQRHALALAIRAGLNQDLDNGVSTAEIVDAVSDGVLEEAGLDRAVSGVLRAKFSLGLFEDPYIDVAVVPETFDGVAERELSRAIAERSTILLKNDTVEGEPLLPLDPAVGRIAVIGPNADRPMGQLGNYSYQVLDSVTRQFAHAANPLATADELAELVGRMGPDDARLMVTSVPIVTFLEGIRRRVSAGTQVVHAQGCSIAGDDMRNIPSAVAAAQSADVAVVVVGDQSGINGFGTVGEGLDSTDCELPGVQRQLIEAVVATGTPTIVVLSHGRMFALGWMAESVPAIVSSLFGGEEAGNAVAGVLFGDVNPAGRLPMSMLKSAGSAPSPYGRAVQGRAYVDGNGGYVYPFGHGLSYTRFQYCDLEIDGEATTDGTIRVAFTVENVGERDGDEVVQIYGQDVVARTARRGRTLLAFRRIALAAGEAARVDAEIPASMVALWDRREGWVVEPGVIKIFVGASSAAIKLRGEVMLTGHDHSTGAGRELFSRVITSGLSEDAAATQSASKMSAAPLTDLSAIEQWLGHPVGRDLLLGALGAGADFDDDALAPVASLPPAQLVKISAGQFSAQAYEAMLTVAVGRGAYAPARSLDASSTIGDWLKHPTGRAALLEALGVGENFDEDTLQPVLQTPLRQLVALSGGQFSQAAYEELLTTVERDTVAGRV